MVSSQQGPRSGPEPNTASDELRFFTGPPVPTENERRELKSLAPPSGQLGTGAKGPQSGLPSPPSPQFVGTGPVPCLYFCHSRLPPPLWQV